MARSRIKPSYKWVGANDVQDIQRIASMSPGLVYLALPGSVIVEANNDVLMETIFISHSISRLLITNVGFLHVLVAMQKIDPSSGLPTEVLDPAAGTGFDIANRDILAWYQLPMPPVLPVGNAGTFVTSDESVIYRHQVNVRRRIQRANHAITITIVNGVADDVIRVRTIARTLLRLN